jgi:phage shock protein C
MDQNSDRGRNVLLVIGAAIMFFGVWALIGQAGFVPAWLTSNWNELRGGLVLIAIGGIVIWASRGGLRAPAAGAQLYRTRGDKWVAGVLGGLGRYFGIEPTLLRLVFLALVLLGVGWPVIGYIVLAIFVPKEPEGYVSPVAVAPPIAPPATPVAPPAPQAPPAPAPVPDAPSAPFVPAAPKAPRRKKAEGGKA